MRLYEQISSSKDWNLNILNFNLICSQRAVLGDAEVLRHLSNSAQVRADNSATLDFLFRDENLV